MSLEIWQRIDEDWHEELIEEWVEKLAGLGFADADIRFSGFSSQGDGANFKADVERDDEVQAPTVVTTTTTTVKEPTP